MTLRMKRICFGTVKCTSVTISHFICRFNYFVSVFIMRKLFANVVIYFSHNQPYLQSFQLRLADPSSDC